MEKNWIELMQDKNQIQKVIEANEYSKRFGLALTPQDAELLIVERRHALKEQRRVEFGQEILPGLIFEFCDSAYISQSNYVETLARLQDIFYLYKNEMLDEITDDELLHLMKELFETICYGDLEYLAGTCLANFAEAVRSGYREYILTDGYGAYKELDPVKRWDFELFMEALMQLF